MSANTSGKTIHTALEKITQVSMSNNRELAKKYRTRARQTPSMLHSIGLLGTISYLFAAAGREEYNKVCKEGTGPLSSRDIQEGTAYALFLKHIIEHLHSDVVGLTKPGHMATKSTTTTTITGRGGLAQTKPTVAAAPSVPITDADNVVYAIHHLSSDTKLLSYCEASLEPFLIELKGFAEALLEDGE